MDEIWQKELGVRLESDPEGGLLLLLQMIAEAKEEPEALALGAWLLSCYGPDHFLSQAIEWAEQACEKKPEDPELRHTAAWANASAERWEQVLGHLHHLLRDPTFAAQDPEDLAHLALKSVPSYSGPRMLQTLEESPSAGVIPGVIAALRMQLGLEIRPELRGEAEAHLAAFAAR